MNIAICDDNVYAVSKLEELLDSVFRNQLGNYKYEVFPSGDTLLAYLEHHPRQFQLYLLDIEMPGISGLETAKKIRQEDSEALIVFVTSHTELMSEAFQVYAFHFITKPFTDDMVKGVVIKAAQLMQDRQALFQFKVGKIYHTVYRSQITCVESYGRKMTLHTRSGETHDYYGTLKATLEQVAGPTFVQVHNSYVVNMGQLDRVSADSLSLQDGQTVPISKKFQTDFHRAYRNYVLSLTV